MYSPERTGIYYNWSCNNDATQVTFCFAGCKQKYFSLRKILFILKSDKDR